jgi:hypothetical protein
MAVRHLGQGDGMVEDGPRIEDPGEHIRQEFGNAGADWGDAPAQRDVAVEHPAQNDPRIFRRTAPPHNRLHRRPG